MSISLYKELRLKKVRHNNYFPESIVKAMTYSSQINNTIKQFKPILPVTFSPRLQGKKNQEENSVK